MNADAEKSANKAATGRFRMIAVTIVIGIIILAFWIAFLSTLGRNYYIREITELLIVIALGFGTVMNTKESVFEAVKGNAKEASSAAGLAVLMGLLILVIMFNAIDRRLIHVLRHQATTLTDSSE